MAFCSREPAPRVGPLGYLVLRPKLNPLGLESPFPEVTGQAGTQPLLSSRVGPWVLAGPPRPPNFRPRCSGVHFIVKRGLGNSGSCSAPLAAGAAAAENPVAPGLAPVGVADA